MADGHLCQRWTFEISEVAWSQKSSLVYTLNPELMHRSIVTDVQICQSHNLPKICIYSKLFRHFQFGY